jgi:transposase InsO family protein
VDKSDVFATFKSFVKDIHNEFKTIIKRVRSDNGSEFTNTRIDELCDEFGIGHQFSTKYTPQSNGLVERKNRTLIDMARSMLSEYNVSQSLGQSNQHCLLLHQRIVLSPVKREDII